MHSSNVALKIFSEATPCQPTSDARKILLLDVPFQQKLHHWQSAFPNDRTPQLQELTKVSFQV